MKVKLNKVAFVNLLYSSAPKPKIFVSLDPLNQRKNNQDPSTTTLKPIFLNSYSLKLPCQVSGNLNVRTNEIENNRVKTSKNAKFFLNFGFQSSEEP